jgi:hypothetical protein
VSEIIKIKVVASEKTAIVNIIEKAIKNKGCYIVTTDEHGIAVKKDPSWDDPNW